MSSALLHRFKSNKVEEVEGDPFPRAPAHTPARVTATFATFRAARAGQNRLVTANIGNIGNIGLLPITWIKPRSPCRQCDTPRRNP